MAWGSSSDSTQTLETTRSVPTVYSAEVVVIGFLTIDASPLSLSLSLTFSLCSANSAQVVSAMRRRMQTHTLSGVSETDVDKEVSPVWSVSSLQTHVCAGALIQALIT
jgi:hypothetical protein